MAPPGPAAEEPLRGIVLMCAAIAVLAVMAAIFKHLAPDYPAVQIVWARYFFHFALVLVLVPRRIPRLLVSQRKDLQVLRSVLMLGATACSVVGVRYLPLADFAAIGFVAPLLVALLSIVVLGETVGVRRWDLAVHRLCRCSHRRAPRRRGHALGGSAPDRHGAVLRLLPDHHARHPRTRRSLYVPHLYRLRRRRRDERGPAPLSGCPRISRAGR